MTLAPATAITNAICMRCDYDLRGLAADARCPECGLAVARSLAPAEDLRHAPPGWLAGLAWGCGLLLASMLGFIAFLFLRGALRGVLTYSKWVDVVAATAFVGGATAGVWLLTRPQRKFAPSGAALRWGLRVLALLALGDVATLYWVVYTGNYRLPPFQQWVMPSAAVVFPALLFLHLRRLARRVLDPRLAEHCAIIGIGTSLMMATALAFQVRAEFSVPRGSRSGCTSC